VDYGKYGFGKIVSGTVASVRPKVEAALKSQGFGILTEIDVQATLKKKLDLNYKPYIILGACNPPLAHQALTAEEEIGLLLPCNVILYECGQNQVKVSVFDPVFGLGMIGNPELDKVGAQAKAKLEAALAAVE